MKRIAIAMVFLLALLVSTTSTAFAGSAWELVSVVNHAGGVTFTFRVSGEFSKNELSSGRVSVDGGDDYPMYCTQKDANTVVCETTDEVGEQSVVINFGGARFWANVPVESVVGTAAPNFCYNVWDWPTGAEAQSGIDEWRFQGVHCQFSAAQQGDDIEFNSPNYGLEWYLFFEQGREWKNVPQSNPGAGYYYPQSPQ